MHSFQSYSYEIFRRALIAHSTCEFQELSYLVLGSHH